MQVSAFDDFLVGEYVTSTVPTGFGEKESNPYAKET